MRLRKQRPNLSNSQRGELFAMIHCRCPLWVIADTATSPRNVRLLLRSCPYLRMSLAQLQSRQLTRRVARYPRMDSLDIYEPNPGSPEAVPLGCTCPPIQHGPRFTVHERCPLHGFETVRTLFQVRPLDQMATTSNQATRFSQH
jgi:hypothetical protein